MKSYIQKIKLKDLKAGDLICRHLQEIRQISSYAADYLWHYSIVVKVKDNYTNSKCVEVNLNDSHVKLRTLEEAGYSDLNIYKINLQSSIKRKDVIKRATNIVNK